MTCAKLRGVDYLERLLGESAERHERHTQDLESVTSLWSELDNFNMMPDILDHRTTSLNIGPGFCFDN